MKPDISVIIPVYNVEKYLKECLESVINQNFDNMEIICVNDGSTDGSAQILQEYQKKDSRLQIVMQENRGLSEARNTGIRQAKGKYICFLDSDDMLCENALAQLFELSLQEDLEILCYDAECIYENERLREMQFKNFYYQRKKAYNQIAEGKEIFAQMMEDDAFCDAAWILFINRKWLLESNIWFWPRLIHEDCLFSFQCFMNAKRVMHTNSRYIIYRIRENSIMTSHLGYGSVYGRLVCFHHVLEFLYSNELIEKHKNAVIKFAEWLKESAKWIGTMLYEDEKRQLKLLSSAQKFELDLMGINEQPIDFMMYKRGFLARIQDAERIAIYGAGKRGKRVLEYITKYQMKDKVGCFLVSELNNNPNSVDSIRVYTMGEDKVVGKECLMIVSMRGTIQEEIGERLIREGYTNIVLLDDKLSTLIAEELLED